MNYLYPIPGAQSDPRAFVANTTLDLGFYDKPVDALTNITVDYSQLVPSVTVNNVTLRVRPGGAPALDVAWDGAAGMSLTFDLTGGIGGQTYTVDIIAILATGERRVDRLTVNVLGDDCGCPALLPLPAASGAVSSGGSVIVNTAPRFFISDTTPIGANVMDGWYDPTTAELYQYISIGSTTEWALLGATTSGGGSGGGGGGGGSVNIFTLSPIHPDGATTIFPLSMPNGPVTVVGSHTLFVSVDGVWQQAGVQYTAAGNKITFTQAPDASSVIFMVWFAPASVG